MSDNCELMKHNGIDSPCDEDTCPYWRVVDHLHLAHGTEGCAIQYFGLLGDRGSEISRWLLSVKRRLALERISSTAVPLHDPVDPSAEPVDRPCSTS